MAKASRSSKKQPAFDPSELEDLIFSPAVGKGVGSHLVRPGHQTTIVTSVTTSEPTPDMSTVGRTGPGATVASPPYMPTVVGADLATVATPLVTPVGKPIAAAKLWITENGDLVSEARVKRIRLAQDVINSAEECVYDTLWNAKLLQADERESCRIVQAGYDYLVKRSRLSRKTIQRIVAKLLEKDFIAIENRADIYQRTSTVYRVFSYKAVLERHVRKGRFYVAKMGPGFSYARPLDEPSTTDMATVDMSNVTPVARIAADMTTVVRQTTVSMVKMDRPTVVKMSPYLLDANLLDNTSSAQIKQALARYGRADDDVARELISACRAHAPDCTEAEIVHFIHEKGRHVEKRESRVHSPIGFLMTAVPKCFSGETLERHREDSAKNRERKETRESDEQAATDQWRREQAAALLDPNVSEQDKHLIRLCLGLNSG